MNYNKLRAILLERLESDGYDRVTRTQIFRETGIGFRTLKQFEKNEVDIAKKTYDKLCKFLGVEDE